MKHISILGLIAFIIISLFASSCQEDRIEIEQQYKFKFTHMPIPTEIAKNGKVEIRCKLESEGKYKDSQYRIRYFPRKGEGFLQVENESPFLPNDYYELKHKEFRMYYKAISSGKHQFDVYIEDNFGQLEKVSFEFDTKEA